MVPKAIRKVVKDFKTALEDGGFPKFDMYLFGSYARKEARPDSDIDICLVSPKFKKDKVIFEKQAVVIAFHIDPRIQVVLADPYKFSKDPLSPLYNFIRKEAIAA